MLCEHFGFIEFVNPLNCEVMEGGVQLPTNTIFQMDATIKQNKLKPSTHEYALSTYSGLYFIHVTKNKPFKRTSSGSNIK